MPGIADDCHCGVQCPIGLQGRLSAWPVEMRAGVWVNDCSARTREMIWEQVTARLLVDNDVIVRKAPTDQGYEDHTHPKCRI